MKYGFLTTDEIKPAGWLKKQLEIAANGLGGNLDKVWLDVKDSKWIGGTHEGWERVPHWLDGFIPIAFLLNDTDMIARAKRYIDYIIDHQEPDGWMCPNGDTPRDQYDLWPVGVFSRTLKMWYECSKDERIPGVLYKFLKNYYDLLSNQTVALFNWGKYRWFEAFPALRLLKEKYPDEDWIIELGKILYEQGAHFEEFTDKWKEYKREWTFETHIVNLALMLKSEAVSYDLLGKEYTHLADRLYDILYRYNGKPVCVFNGDECLSGIDPIQGTELCAVVEQMYSYEWLYAVTGESIWAERLEKAAFNALPAQNSEDMWTHQYNQMSNQIECTPFMGDSVFGTNTNDAHIFGLEPNYGCCTVDHVQGWPRLALFSWLKTDEGYLSSVPLPSCLCVSGNGVDMRISLDTEYPFENTFTYTVEASGDTDTVLSVRIPSFAKNLQVNGEETENTGMLTFAGFTKGTTVITVSYETSCSLQKAVSGMYYAEKGSLVFSLPIEGTWEMHEYELNGVERKFPYCDYFVKGSGDFNYGFAGTEMKAAYHGVSDVPFAEKKPPVTLEIPMSHIDWEFRDEATNCCKPYPNSSKKLDAPAVKTLIPYGCTTLRMTEMPICDAD